MSETTSTFHSGFLGSGYVGTFELPIVKWGVQAMVKLQQFANSRSGGFILRDSTFKDCAVTLDLDYDFTAGQGPFSPTGGGLTISTVLSNLALYLHQTGSGGQNGQYWSFTSLIVDTTPVDLMVDGKIITRVTAKGSGSFVYPS